MFYLAAGKQEIQSLAVECDYVDWKCQWKGTVGTLAEHLTVCEFTPVPCPTDCEDQNGEISRLLRNNLENHLAEECPNRDYKCEYCGEKGTYASITHVHDRVCEQKVIPCTNADCSATMQRHQLQHHINSECEHSVVACKRKEFGCDVQLKRREIEEHEQDDTIHLHVAMDTISTLMKHCSMLQKQCLALKQECNSLKEQCCLQDYMRKKAFTFRVTGYQEKKLNSTRVFSPPFYTSHNGYRVNIAVYPNGCGKGKDTHLSVYVYFLKARYNAQLNWPFIGRVTFALLNQTRNSHYYEQVMPITGTNNVRAETSRNNWGISMFYPHSDLELVSDFLKDDALYFRVSFQVDSHKPWLECTCTTIAQR